MFFAALFGSNIDFSPLLETAFSALSIAATTLVGFGIRWLNSKTSLLNLQNNEQIQQMFNEVIHRSMAYATKVVKGKIPTSATISNPFVAAAARYALERWPDLMRRAGLDEDSIRETILARLPSLAAEKADAIVVAKAGAPAAVPVAKK